MASWITGFYPAAGKPQTREQWDKTSHLLSWQKPIHKKDQIQVYFVSRAWLRPPHYPFLRKGFNNLFWTKLRIYYFFKNTSSYRKPAGREEGKRSFFSNSRGQWKQNFFDWKTKNGQQKQQQKKRRRKECNKMSTFSKHNKIDKKKETGGEAVWYQRFSFCGFL